MTTEQLMIAATVKLITIWGPVILTSFAVYPIAKRFF